MAKTIRVTLSMNSDLLEQFDRTRTGRCASNRSEAVRLLMQDSITPETSNKDDRDVAATLTLTYGSHCSELVRRLTELQHQVLDLVVSTTRVHLEAGLCMEVIILKGRSARLSDFASRLGGTKGVWHGGLVVASSESAS